MIPLTAEEAGLALGLAPLAAPVAGVSIDSRSLKSGDLFVALRGERFDGHDFVAAAFAAGASGAVVERAAGPGGAGGPYGAVGRGGAAGPAAEQAFPDRRLVYEVRDTLEALQALATAVRRKAKVTVFAITGSVGKTSTKDLLEVMVGQVRRVVATAANQNNEVGVPLTLLAIEPDTEAVIVEMGMRGRGQIAALTRVTEPDIGVITNVHPVHLELLGTLEGIAEAKAELVDGLGPGAAAVVPAECGVLRRFVSGARCRVVSFATDGEAGGADVVGWLAPREGTSGHTLVLRWPGGQAEMETAYVPRHRVVNVVTAAAACYAAGLAVEECVKGITAVEFTGGRGDVAQLPGLWVIDDTYNASPAAVRAALDDLIRRAAESGGRPVAVLGDMLELGEESERYHREVGEYAAEVGVRALWGVGPRSGATVEGFRRAWKAKGAEDSEWSAGHVGSSEESSSVAVGLRRDDVVLFKASRSMRLEIMMRRIVEEAEAGMWNPLVDAGRGPGAGSKENR